MSAMFGHTWASQYGDEPNGSGGDTWAAALAGITPAQIAAGLRATLTVGSDWPPSAPRFRAMCLGVPSFPYVLRAVQTRDASVPFGAKRKSAQTDPNVSAFVRLTWSFIDTYRLRQVDADKAERMIRDAYELAREHVMSGGNLPEEPAGAIEAPKEPEHKPADPETAKQHMEHIAAMLHVAEEPQA